jgi:phage protein U
MSSTLETNFAEHALIEGKPKLQRIGTNLTAIEVSILLDVSFCEPQAEIDALNSSRESAEVMPLIMGDGRFVGNFVIQTVSDTPMHSAGNGRVLQSEVTLSLLEYANANSELSFASSSIAQAFANVNNSPPTFIPEMVAITPEMETAQELVGANASINTTADVLATLQANVDLYRPKAEQITQDMLNAGDSLSNVLEAINADSASEMYARTRNLALKISETILVTADVSVEATALIADIDAGNTSSIPGRVVSLVNKGIELSNKSRQLSQQASDLISLIVVQ